MFKKILDFLKKIPSGVAEFVINKILFVTFGDKLKSYRTLILNILTMVLAAWEFLSKDGGLFELLCDQVEAFAFLMFFCDIDKGEFYAGALVVVGWLNVLLRKLTTTPMAYKGDAPSAYTSYETPQPVNLVMVGSIGLILAFFWRLFVG